MAAEFITGMCLGGLVIICVFSIHTIWEAIFANSCESNLERARQLGISGDHHRTIIRRWFSSVLLP